VGTYTVSHAGKAAANRVPRAPLCAGMPSPSCSSARPHTTAIGRDESRWRAAETGSARELGVRVGMKVELRTEDNVTRSTLSGARTSSTCSRLPAREPLREPWGGIWGSEARQVVS